MNDKTIEFKKPVIERREKNNKYYLHWGEKEFGPWDELDREVKFSPDNNHWAIRGMLHERSYVLSDGGKYGPFDYRSSEPWYDPGRKAFAFTANRGKEFFLIADGKIVKKGKTVENKGGEVFLLLNRRRYGPFQNVYFPAFSLSGRRWAAQVDKEGQSRLLLDGKEYGPFPGMGVMEFSKGAELFACRCDRGQGEGLLIEGEQFFGPYQGIFGPFFSPDGRRWGMDVGKGEKWHGFVVDGSEYGPFPFQYFVPRFSGDSRHWSVVLDSGYEDRPHSFILDGKRFGPFKISEVGFMEDGRFVCTFSRRGKYYIHLDERLIGPFRHEKNDAIRVDGELLAIMGHIKKGRETPRRCVISCRVGENDKHVFFSPNSGETVADAIEVINTEDTNEGVAAEHHYMQLLLGSEARTGEFIEQRLIHQGERSFDQLIYKVNKNETQSLFFDITSFYGKFNEPDPDFP